MRQTATCIPCPPASVLGSNAVCVGVRVRVRVRVCVWLWAGYTSKLCKITKHSATSNQRNAKVHGDEAGLWMTLTCMLPHATGT